ncbi:MAG TPA: tetratricopeptide repeat protein, partial [Anaerolineae bacterium]|nr:tetratricopeptide repeat protein [Anaerolineae bacterium]
EESLEIERKLGNQAGIAKSLHQLGTLAQLQGDNDEARRLYEESLEIERKLGNQAGIAKSLHQLGMLAEIEGTIEDAADLFEQSLDILDRLQSPDAETERGSLARVREKLGS